MHQPVLLNEVIKYLNPKSGENFIDCTFGAGGHSLAILKKNNPGKVLAIDWDKAVSLSKHRLILVNDNFKNLKRIVEEHGFFPVHGILFDLGWHIDRGLRFKRDEPLLASVKTILQLPEQELFRIFKEYGEEKYSRRIAKAIKKAPKPIKTTGQLRKIIENTTPRSKSRRGQIDRVLARIFQALRIVVNDELENLKQGLEQAVEILEPGGRLVVISFHSLEDRIVKNFFRNNNLEILTKKPIMASEQEIKNNPRSRSAKLRAVIKR